ncbi:MAG TPA: hypothetical protein VKB51_12525, partial [bacterium]|nr:hypothetical protein [bacterium]
YFPADTLKTFLPRFHIGAHNDLDARLHRFVTQALVLFRAEIEHLLDERDATFARYRETHGGASPFEDRALEITSALPADVPAQMARIAAELQRRGAMGEVGGAGVPAGAPGMTIAEAVVDEVLAERSTTQLQHNLAAGLALREIEARLRAQGRTVVEAVMNGKPYEHWRMYPWDTGVTDKTTGSQYFYHAHPEFPEHGHFHLFCHDHGQLVHLVAVAMDDRGEPVGLSTVNRWVTGDLYLPPHEVLAFLPRFRIENDAFDRMVSDYLRQLLLLFQPEIGALVRERERVFVDYRAAHAGREPFEDRDLEVTSTLPIDVEGHIARLEAELRRRSEG